MRNTAGLLPRPDKGLVLLYAHDLPEERNYRVYANDRLITDSMGEGRFINWYADAGELRIASSGNSEGHARAMEDIAAGDQGGKLAVGINEALRSLRGKKDMLDLHIAPGQVYFVNMHSGFARERMDLVSAAEGEAGIQDCRRAR
jgi:hypothetical protein